VIVETMSAADEACLAVRAVKENTSMVAIASFSYDTKSSNGYRTMMGLTPAEAARRSIEAGADIIGSNCSLSTAEMAEVVDALKQAAPDYPVLAHPNAGRPVQHPDGSIEYPETPEIMAESVPALIKAGANIIGGCCGSGPDHIRAIRAAVEEVLGD
jgi:5-methyltetrahydrofolate--homocysteine methyltransferase